VTRFYKASGVVGELKRAICDLEHLIENVSIPK